MRIITFFLFLGTALFGATMPLQAQTPLRIAVDVPYPPFAFIDGKGNLTGFDVDIAKALCAEIKRECEIKIVSFDQIIPEIVAGNIDIGLAGMGRTPEREKLVDFTDRYFRSHSIFIEKPGTVPSPTRNGLTGRRVGTQSGTAQEIYLNEEYKDIITILLYPTFEDLLQALKDEKIDTALVDGLPAYTYLKSEEGADYETLGDPIESDVLVAASSIVVSKTLPEITQQLNSAIQALRNNGTYGKINRKYFDFDIY